MRRFLTWLFRDVLSEARALNEKHQRDLQLAASALRTVQEAYVDLEKTCLTRLDDIESALRGGATWRDVEYRRAGLPEGPGLSPEQMLNTIKRGGRRP